MKNKIALVLSLAIFSYAHSETKSDKTPGTGLKKIKFYSISALKAKKPSSGSFNTEGYVVKIYTCPPCPKGARCKPCMRDNVVISENANLLESYVLTHREMILFTARPRDLELGIKYRFSIRITDYSSTSEPLNDIELEGWEPVQAKNKSGLKK